MAQLKKMIEMNRLAGEILKAGNKFLQDHKANEAKERASEYSANGTHSEGKETHDERGEGYVAIETLAPKRVR